MATILTWQVLLPAQVRVTTWHYDNARTGANTSETILTSVNVASSTFGHLLSRTVDGEIVGQALYLPAVTIPGNGTHNVVYVATNHDSVYAFDADNALGSNAQPLWVTSVLTYSGTGATSAPIKTTGGSQTGMTEHGIISTPVIDPTTNTMYLEAETYEGGQVVHRLHALDVTTGLETLGGPTTITATYSVNNATATFHPTHQMNRPGLLLQNGHIYIGFGGPYASTNGEQGWVMSYNAATLQQEGVWASEPGRNFASVWHHGAGLAGDAQGNVYAETGEGYFSAGTNFSISVLKLTQNGTTLPLTDWFAPYNHAFLSNSDLDLADGILVLPDQTGPYPHELVAAGKSNTIYVLNRDNMGQVCTSCSTTDTQIIQEFNLTGVEPGAPALWNGVVYFTPYAQSIQAFALNSGLLTPLPIKTVPQTGGGHAIITSNGNSNGILWTMNGNTLSAFNANTLGTLYTSTQAAGNRDVPPALPHFPMPIVASGRLYLNAMNSLEVYGLLPTLSATAGNSQSGPVGSTLPSSLQVTLTDPYTGTVVSGSRVSFSDGGKGGTFDAVQEPSDGVFSVNYTLPTKAQTVTITASGPGFASATLTVTAVAGQAVSIAAKSGNGQKAPVGTPLPNPLVEYVADRYGNAVPGATVTFSDNGVGSIFSANPVATSSAGLASVIYTTGTKPGTATITASIPGAHTSETETVTGGPPANIAVVSGAKQTANLSTKLTKPLVAKVTDQYSNALTGVTVTFSDGGAGGTFSVNPVITTTLGTVTTYYTAGTKAGALTITAVVPNLSAAQFAETINPGPATAIVVASGNNQSAAVSTALPQPLVSQVNDRYGNPVSGVKVTYSDGGAGGNFSANPITSDTHGLAAVTYTTGSQSGPVTITASGSGLSPATFQELVIGQATQAAVVSGNNQSAAVSTGLPQPLVVKITDKNSNPVPGIPVTFSDGSAGGSFSANPITTDNQGFASVNYTTGTQAGAVTISAAGPSTSTAQFSESVTAGAAALVVVVSGSNQTATVATPLPQSLVAKVTDQYGNAVTGVSVTFSDGGAGGSFSASPVTTDNQGFASVNYTTGTQAGAVTISAGANGTNTVQFAESVTAGTVKVVTAVAGNNQTGVVGTPLPQGLVVRVTDQYGNPVVGAQVIFGDGGAGGTFVGNPATADNNGNASVTYTAGTHAATLTIAAACGSAGTQFSETVLPGPAAVLSPVSGNNQTGQVVSQLAQPVIALVSDIYGNAIPGVQVSFSDNSAGGSFSASPVLSDSSGLASVVYTTGTQSGTVTISAVAPGTNTAQFSETVTAGPAAAVTVVSGSDQTTPVSTQPAQALVVSVTDQFGNGVPGVSVTFDDGGAGGSFAVDPVITNAAGLASAIYTAPASPGTVTITASTGNVTPAVFSLTVTN